MITDNMCSGKNVESTENQQMGWKKGHHALPSQSQTLPFNLEEHSQDSASGSLAGPWKSVLLLLVVVVVVVKG